MNDNEIIAQQAREIIVLRNLLSDFKKARDNIHMEIYCIGGPLNDNKLQYSHKQRMTFHDIWKHLEGLEYEYEI